MPDTTTTLFITSTDVPISRLLPPDGTGRVWLLLPGGITLSGEPQQVRAWLQSGLDALADAMAPNVVPEHPSVNHAPKPGTKDIGPLCGAEAGTVGAGPVSCPLCTELRPRDAA